MAILVPAASTPGTLVYEWVDPTGVVRALSGNASVNVEVGERGLGLPGLELVDEKLPNSAGSALRHANTQPRDVELPLLLEASSSSALEQLLDSVYDWFATADETTRTPGYLRVTRTDGTQRQVACYYTGDGLVGDLSSERAGATWQSVVINLRAPDPTTTDIEETVEVYGSADVGSELSVINPGTMDAYPVWTITGPASAITVRNTTTGKAFALTASGGLTLTAGDQVIVDTRPSGQRTTLQVVDQDGNGLFSKLEPTVDGNSASLWRLVTGQNRFTIDMDDATGDTEIQLSYLPRYRGLLR